MKRSIVALCATLWLPGISNAATTVSACGATVSDGVLAADLDCSATPGFAVNVAAGGSLDLAGHRLISSVAGDAQGFCGGIRCNSDCSVVGNGGSVEAAEPFDWNDACHGSGIVVIYPARGDVSVSGVTISGYEQAAAAWDLTVSETTALENNSGFSARHLVLESVTLTNTIDWGFFAASGKTLRISDSTITGGAGIGGARVSIYRSTITGMHDFGAHAMGNRDLKRFYAEDSVIDQNCQYPSNENCGDILSTRHKPELVNTTCSTSVRFNRISETWTSWGICAND